MERSFSHEEVSTITTVNDRLLNKCFLQKETKNEVLRLKAFQVEGDSFSFLVTYPATVVVMRHENLDGHVIKFPLERADPVRQLEHNIPKQFLFSQETCLDHVMIVLSEMHLPSDIQERIVHYISSVSVKFNRTGQGLRVEVEFEVNEDRFVRIECRCRVRERAVARKVTDMDCPICLTDLSSAMGRMELQCSHVFHSDCVMKWINYKNPSSCPICRARALGETVTLF